jgi:hypothetical protein
VQVDVEQEFSLAARPTSRLSFARARDTWAFTVTSANPRICAASLVVIPSKSRNWNALRNEGGSSATDCMMRSSNSDFIYSASGLGLQSANLSDKQ